MDEVVQEFVQMVFEAISHLLHRLSRCTKSGDWRFLIFERVSPLHARPYFPQSPNFVQRDKWQARVFIEEGGHKVEVLGERKGGRD
jgi:hypothetical protein